MNDNNFMIIAILAIVVMLSTLVFSLCGNYKAELIGCILCSILSIILLIHYLIIGDSIWIIWVFNSFIWIFNIFFCWNNHFK